MLGMNGILSGTGSEYDFTTTTSTPEDSDDSSDYIIIPVLGALSVVVVWVGAPIVLGIIECRKKIKRDGGCFCLRKKQDNGTEEADGTESPHDTESTNTPSPLPGITPSRQERTIDMLLNARTISGDTPARGCQGTQSPSTGHLDLSGILTERRQSDNTPRSASRIPPSRQEPTDEVIAMGSIPDVNTLNDELQSETERSSGLPPYDSDFPPSYGDIFQVTTAHNDTTEPVESPPPSYCEVLINPSYPSYRDASYV